MLAQRFGRLADFPLAGQEDEDVARPQPRDFIGRIDDGVVEITLVVLLVEVVDRTVAHLDRVQPARHLDHRRAVEMLREALGIDGRRGDDQLQVGPPGQQLLQVAEQEIDVQAALVRLVDDDRLVGVQVGIALRLGKQDAVGHQLDPAVRRGLVVEADLDADAGADLGLQLLRQAGRHRAGGQPARLGVADQAAGADAEIEADFRQLRRLARAGFAADDDHLVPGDQLGDIGPLFIDRQFGLEFGFGQAGATFRHSRFRALMPGGEIGLRLVALIAHCLAQFAGQGSQLARIDREGIEKLIVAPRMGALLSCLIHGAGLSHSPARHKKKRRPKAAFSRDGLHRFTSCRPSTGRSCHPRSSRRPRQHRKLSPGRPHPRTCRHRHSSTGGPWRPGLQQPAARPGRGGGRRKHSGQAQQRRLPERNA